MSAARPQTILVVDPDTQVCQLLEATLRLKDYKVVSTGNAIDTIGFLAGQLPDLVVCEVELPEMDGFEFFRRVRGTVRASEIPFILVSARNDPREGAKALRLGVEEYIRKPYSVDELLVRMERIFEEVKRRRYGEDMPDLEGRMERLPFIDLVYLLEQLGWSGRLNVTSPGEQFQGLALLWQGRIGHAVFGFLQGRAALLQMLLRARGHFSFHADDRQVVPVVSVQGSAVDIIDQGLQLVEQRWLGFVDVSKEDACRTFHQQLEEQYPADQIPAGSQEIAADDPDGATRSLKVDLPGRNATVSQSVEMIIEDAAEVVNGGPWITTDDLLEGTDGLTEDGLTEDGLSTEDDLGSRTSIVIPCESGDDITGAFNVDELVEPPEPSYEERTLEPDEAKILEALFSSLIHRLLGERYELGVESIQINTRKGKLLRSTIGDPEQQTALSDFATRAIQFAEDTPQGRYAELAASDLFLMVIELPQGWLLTLVFDKPPPALELMAEIQPLIQETV